MSLLLFGSILCGLPNIFQAQQFMVNQLRNLAVTAGSEFTFDVSFEITIPSEGDAQVTLEFDLSITVTFSNSSIYFTPIKIPYLIAPETRPIVFEIGSEKKYEQPPPKYPYDPYSYDAYYGQGSPYFQPVDSERRNLLIPSDRSSSSPTSKTIAWGKSKVNSISKKKKKRKKSRKKTSSFSAADAKRTEMARNYTRQAQDHHYRNRRSLAAASAQNRADLFSMISQTMEHYGLDGQACVCRAICELAELEMLIESPIHEIIEHILR